MCTVSAGLSPDGAALRLVINRDERRLRMAARPPALFERDGVRAIWPVDQQSGGTWAAVTSHGLAFALLNASGQPAPIDSTAEPLTRGAIIPYLVAGEDIDDVERRFVSGPARWPCRPFKLVVAARDRVVLLTPGGACELTAPAVLSTSSLGDQLVDTPRRLLFEHLLETSDHAWQAQDRLHRHAWPDRRHLSVLMSRADACTVSRTEILLTRERSELRYAAISDGWPIGIAAPAMTLDRRRAAAAA